MGAVNGKYFCLHILHQRYKNTPFHASATEIFKTYNYFLYNVSFLLNDDFVNHMYSGFFRYEVSFLWTLIMHLN